MSILNGDIPKIWTFDHFFGIDAQLVNNLSSLTAPKKRSFGHFSGVRNMYYHISFSFFDMEEIWLVIANGELRKFVNFNSLAISSEDSFI